jgi:hypothetical protein
MRWITTATGVQELRGHYLENGRCLTAQVARSTTTRELLYLARKHAAEEYGEDLAQLISAHSQVTARALTMLARLHPNSSAVANAIATSGRAPISLLQRFATSHDKYLREHAELALLSRRLDGGGLRRFWKALEENRGEDGEAIARRSVVLLHPKVPKEILTELRNDPIDSFAKEANRRLRRLSRKTGKQNKKRRGKRP